MKLVQKILSHGLLIAFIIAAFFIYMNRTDLFPQWFAKKAPATAEPAKVKEASPATVTTQVSRPDAGGDTQEPVAAKPDTGGDTQEPVAAKPDTGGDTQEPVAAKPDTDGDTQEPVAAKPDTDVSETDGETPDVTHTDDQVQAGVESVQSTDVQQSPATDDSEPVFRPLTKRESAEVDDSIAEDKAGAQQTDVVSATPEETGATTEPVVTEQAAVGKDNAAADRPDDVQQSPASDDSEPVFRPLTKRESAEVDDSMAEDKAGAQQTDVVSATPEETGATVEPVVAEQAAAGRDTVAASDYQGRLEEARSYFWQRDISAALQAYQSLAESYPDRADVWGELGNLYFNTRKTSDATDSYARALELLIEQGDDAGARALLNVMYRLDARRASQFEMRLRQTGG